MTSEEQKARMVLDRSKMRRALWEIIWERAHPRPKSVDDRLVQAEPMPHLPDDVIKRRLKDILRRL